jgi:glutamine synthetase
MVLFDYDLEKMLYVIPPEKHDESSVREILKAHPEVRFVSLVGIDIGGHDTDEKIPVAVFLENFEKLMKDGVQTDGSSVVLPKIAGLSNAKVDIIPDAAVNWFVDHNYKNTDGETGLPVGTLRIPSFLRHNDIAQVGARVTLNKSIEAFSLELRKLLEKYPYVFDNLMIDSVDEIEDFVLTSATELEFWVKTPEDEADKLQLSTAQMLKEQYWKRTIGAVRSSLERTLIVMDKYGFEVEMGHKEVGGVKAGMDATGHFNHVMEQLEIDWKYSHALQAADNENQVKYIVRDIFRMHGLEVTFNAKPIEGVAGNGEHTHIGLAAKLKDGRIVNLFAPENIKEDYMSPIGYGALMGILKNYDIINPFVSWTNDAFNRLKPGYEAPVCVVTSLGHSVQQPSRNRTVLIGLIRDMNNPLATRFELRSPNPKSNTYLVCASAYMAMLDGIKAVLEAGKTSKELEASISKEYGAEDFYLEKDRMYRSEKNLFEEYTQEERDKYFGHAPRNVWENIKVFDEQTERTKIFETDDVMSRLTLDSYQYAIVAQWKTELHDRIVPNVMNKLRTTVKLHNEETGNDYDQILWAEIDALRHEMGKNTLKEKCLLSQIKEALDNEEYDKASDLQIEMQAKVEHLSELYTQYQKNLF